MRDILRLRIWAGPLTIGSFVVVAVTGIMLFFHCSIGATKLAHEWLGWLLIIGGAAHLLVNWKTFLAYLRKPAGIAIMASLCILGLLSLLPVGGAHHHRGGPRVMLALEQSPLDLVAQVAKCSPQSAVDVLQSSGVQVQHQEQTICEIASANGKPSMEILACVMGNSASGFTRSPADR